MTYFHHFFLTNDGVLNLVWWILKSPPGSLDCLHFVMMATLNKDLIEEGTRVFYRHNNENIAKGTTDPRVEFISQNLN